ncbi:hypothetical protein OIU34_22500 [Pararhizobium sp. BT-229]|uniref:hypothetical protein n=1 Tax=Pararhizobium sp. BT-229 TaxID=2986923 RepID=UPI0021F7876B|nr:hypothetical protein [Pararhizobium sp. BT-229]MCV9964665.1 hypothetical protein [Pararhizobium sp. BT-229]
MNTGSEWATREGGSIDRRGPAGDLHVLLPVISGWRLEHYPAEHIPTPWHMDFFWEAPNPDLLLAFSDFLSEQAEQDTMARTDKTAVVRGEDGYVAVADWRGTNSFTALLASPDGRTIGSYSGRTNSPLATFVFGERTIHGSQSLQETHMGKGLANLLVDAAEQLTGLHAAPHGHMFTPGSCSEAAWRFWNKRATHKRVPGLNGDQIVQKRHTAALEMEAKRLSTRVPDEPATAARYAGMTGADLVIAERQGEIGFAWCVLDGRRVSRSRLIDDAAILRHNLGLWVTWTDPPVSLGEVTLTTVSNSDIDSLHIPPAKDADIAVPPTQPRSAAPTLMF